MGCLKWLISSCETLVIAVLLEADVVTKVCQELSSKHHSGVTAHTTPFFTLAKSNQKSHSCLHHLRKAQLEFWHRDHVIDTGFFDLPLELRQMIYDEIHSIQGRSYFLGAATNCNLGAEARASDPRVDVELHSWMLKNTQALVVTITNEPLEFPSTLNLDSLKDVHITIGHYTSWAREYVWNKKRNTWRRTFEKNLDPLRENLVKLGEFLKKAPHPLQDLKITFENDFYKNLWGIDDCWYTAYSSFPEPDLSDSEDEFDDLRIRGAFWKPFTTPCNRRMPVVQYLLEPLWEYPEFSSASIELPTTRQGVDLTVKWDQFDNNYMEEHKIELQKRLEGMGNRGMRRFMERWRGNVDRSYEMRRARGRSRGNGDEEEDEDGNED